MSGVTAKKAKRRMVDTVLAVRPDAFTTRRSAREFVNWMIEDALKRGRAACYSFEFARDVDGDIRMFVCVADVGEGFESGGFIWTNHTVGVWA